MRSAAATLCALAERDARVRAELAADGTLFDGYHPRMEAVHRENASRLREIIEDSGWPTDSLVGPEAAEAAWLVVQHSIGEPDFQRRCLTLLRGAAARGEVPAWQPAMLEDRIRMFEGRPQVYGTQLDEDAEGWLRPWPIDDPAGVDERRRRVGLGPLAEAPQRAERVRSQEESAAREREYKAWLRRVGWRSGA